MDFGCHQEAFIDPERANHVKSNYNKDFNIVPSDPSQPDVKNLRTCLRPQSCDDLPIIGQLSYFPNVVLNAGHGGHGTSISFACAKMVQDIVDGTEETLFNKQITDACHTKRCFV